MDCFTIHAVLSIKVMTLVENAMYLTLIGLLCQGQDQINHGESHAYLDLYVG